METPRPPFVDEHRIVIDAPAERVWPVLASEFGRSGGRLFDAYARFIGARPPRSSGAPLAEGSTLPGFAVVEAVPGRSARLVGRHLYARYELTFDLAERPGGTLVRARTYASFPGPLGRVYRLLVIDSGAHRALMVRRLAAVRKRAEQAR
ncbi:SRPBCC family protein [Streptomyces endophyticus]|uniref:DUF2867 domain-containing protein n=1 Tax=Streptomyces endophyticus TaxID=714166 RepID=A0ABU6FL28_9ACTN|nr:hypothetical protein [Streptomyces endophyticus]MEB8344233.1 hypothetical protein [Streptomyces endophyticus]